VGIRLRCRGRRPKGHDKKLPNNGSSRHRQTAADAGGWHGGKDRDERFVPIHPKIANLLAEYTRGDGLVLPALNQTSLLRHLKELCAEYEFENPMQYKLHSFRHYFASMCANHGVAHRKALAWLGHSNSDMLDLYYHLHDDDSMQTMAELAKSSSSEQVVQYPKLKAV